MGEGNLSIVAVYNRQKVINLEESILLKIQAAAEQARIALIQLKPSGVLSSLGEIELTIIDDPTIARVHGEFFDDSSATDVITFEHGEILISVETAERQAKKFDNDFHRELALYAIHGLAHLAGFDDRVEDDQTEMTKVQEELLDKIWAS